MKILNELYYVSEEKGPKTHIKTVNIDKYFLNKYLVTLRH